MCGKVEQILSVQEHTEKHQKHDERCSRNWFNPRFSNDTNGNCTKQEGGHDEHGCKHQRSEDGETAHGENYEHGEECNTHEDWNVLEWPFIPSLAFHVLLASFPLEGGANV